MYLGIDIGTSAVKAVLASGPSAVTATAHAPLEVSRPHPGWSEQDPGIWWAATQVALGALKETAGPAWDGAKAIGLSGQMHGAVLLDGSRKPIRPAILWNDGRSAAQCAKLAAAMPEIGEISGAIPMPGFTAPKLMWVREHEPEAYAQIKHVLLPKDFVRLALTGELATDMADAAGTMWLNEATRSWDTATCDASQTDRAWLPRLLEGTEISGSLSAEAAAALGLKAGIPVAAGGGDAAAGAMGIGAVAGGDAFVSLGTSGQFFVTSESYAANPAAAVHAYAHCVPGRWFQMAAMLNGASPMQWFADFAQEDIGALLSEAALTDTDTAPLFLPYLTGERTPHNDPNIRGAFYGLTPAAGRADAMRGIINAVAYCFCDGRDSLGAAAAGLDRVAAIGGGARSDFVLQTLSDALGVSMVRFADAEQGPALGAARLAMVASGDMTVAEAAETPETDRAFEPNAEETERHARTLERWRELYRALKPFAAESAAAS